jgi:site-specific DNA-adenine methylase
MKRDVISLFPYVGGKAELAMHIVEMVYETYSKFPEVDTYIEPCGGGGRVILNLPRRGRQIYSEYDPCLSNLFWAAADRQRVTELIHRLEKIPVSKETYKKMHVQYKKWRDGKEPMPKAMESAAYAYYLTHLARNGRVGIPGFYSGSEGMKERDKDENYFTEEAYYRSFNRLPDFPEILQGVEFYTGDCVAFLREYDTPNVIQYVDPPYLKDSYLDKKILAQVELTLKSDVKKIQEIRSSGGEPVFFNYKNVKERKNKQVDVTYFMPKVDADGEPILDDNGKQLREKKTKEMPFIDVKLRNDYTSGIALELHMRIIEQALKSKAKIIISGYNNSLYDHLVEAGWRRIKMGELAVVSSHKAIKEIETEYVWLNF